MDATSHDLEDAKFDTNTVVVGADYRVNPNVTLGALFHDSQTDNAKMDEHGSRVDVDGRGVGIYAGYREGGVYVNGLLTYSTNDYKSQRKVKFTGYNHTAKGDTNGDQTGFGVDGGYDFKVSDALTVGPFVGMQYVHLNVDGFRETGAPGANLKVSEQSMTSMLGRVGARLNYTSGMFSTDLHAALQHEFANDSRDITAQFIGSGLDAFSVKTTDPEPELVPAGGGPELELWADDGVCELRHAGRPVQLARAEHQGRREDQLLAIQDDGQGVGPSGPAPFSCTPCHQQVNLDHTCRRAVPVRSSSHPAAICSRTSCPRRLPAAGARLGMQTLWIEETII